jgi:hypothetical protein
MYHYLALPTGRFKKWQVVKKFWGFQDLPKWADEYADLLEIGRAKYANCSMPLEVWASISASTHSISKARAFAEWIKDNTTQE